MIEVGQGLPDPIVEQLVKEFNDSNDKINVKLEPIPGQATDYEMKIMANLLSGNPPDLFTTHDNTNFKYAKERLLEPLPKDIADYVNKNLSLLLKGAIRRSLSYNNILYGIPWEGDWVALYYNMDMYKESGIKSPPRTLSEMMEHIKKLARYDDKGNVIRSGYTLRITGHPAGIFDKFVSFYTAYGGTIINNDLTRFLIDSPEGEKAAQYYLDILYKYKADAVTMVKDTTAFAQKLAALHAREPATVVQLKTRAPDMKFGINYGVVPFPKEKATARNAAFIDALVVPSNAKNKNEAWEFVRWLLKPENYTRLQIGMGSIPLLEFVARDPYFSTTGDGRYMEVFLKEALWIDPPHSNFYEAKTKIGEYLERIFYQKIGLKEGLSEAVKEANSILNR
jgi:multiple sugar transport system substrate-binding protein